MAILRDALEREFDVDDFVAVAFSYRYSARLQVGQVSKITPSGKRFYVRFPRQKYDYKTNQYVDEWEWQTDYFTYDACRIVKIDPTPELLDKFRKALVV